MRPTRPLFPFVLALPLIASCSSGAAQDSTGGTGGTGPGGIIITGTSSNRDGGIIFGDNACVAEPLKGEPIPVDIYVMFDQSGSMATPVGAGTRLDAVRAAATSFLNAP